MRPELRESLEINRAYWLSMQTADDLGKEETLPALRDDLGARKYDIFGTANFFNFIPWTTSTAPSTRSHEMDSEGALHAPCLSNNWGALLLDREAFGSNLGSKLGASFEWRG